MDEIIMLIEMYYVQCTPTFIGNTKTPLRNTYISCHIFLYTRTCTELSLVGIIKVYYQTNELSPMVHYHPL